MRRCGRFFLPPPLEGESLPRTRSGVVRRSFSEGGREGAAMEAIRKRPCPLPNPPPQAGEGRHRADEVIE